jgi:hypothetical protein
MRLQVFRHDSFTCRYCSRETIFVPVLRALSEAFPEALPYQSHWKLSLCHPIYWRLSASIDHVDAVKRGGSCRRRCKTDPLTPVEF